VENTTTVVIISVFAFAAYFAVVDAILKTGTDRLFKFFSK
jgi:preprotein translocase subunit SecE